MYDKNKFFVKKRNGQIEILCIDLKVKADLTGIIRTIRRILNCSKEA